MAQLPDEFYKSRVACRFFKLFFTQAQFGLRAAAILSVAAWKGRSFLRLIERVWAIAGRLKCDEMLGRYLDMWRPEVEVTVVEFLAERLTKAREQVGRTVEVHPDQAKHYIKQRGSTSAV